MTYKNITTTARKLLIIFSIDNSIANISLYALSRPKLNFECYLTFEFAVKALKSANFALFWLPDFLFQYTIAAFHFNLHHLFLFQIIIREIL